MPLEYLKVPLRENPKPIALKVEARLEKPVEKPLKEPSYSTLKMYPQNSTFIKTLKDP